MRARTWTAALSVTALTAGTLAATGTPVGAVPSSTPSRPGHTYILGTDDPHGSARSLRTVPGRPLARPSGVSSSASPAGIAAAVVREYAGALHAQGATFRTESVHPGVAAGHVVRLQQTVAGVPVMGGEVVVDLDQDGNTRSVASETLTQTPAATRAAVPASLATSRALASVRLSAHTGALVASTPELTVYDPRIFGAPGLQRSSLVWKLDVTSPTDPSLKHLVLVDALHGVVTLDVDQTEKALDRRVCDQGNIRSDNPPDCTTPVRSESEAVVGSPDDDINVAYDYAGVTYDFYSQVLGRDSIDGAGLPIRSTVRYCDNVSSDPCPNYPNAFWDGTQMYYGSGFANADDVVAHELTHGVTQYNNNLYYFFQSGAINESLSDIFGEYIDQWDADKYARHGTDGPSVDWLIGEDIPGYPSGFRNMAAPHLSDQGAQPERMGDPLWDVETNTYGPNFDSGGVHVNSGVGNKFGYLIGRDPSAGSVTFTGQAVTGIGIEKAAEVVYGASKLLTSGADYRAFATALRASCSALVGSSSATTPLAAGDCDQVNAALLATQMDQEPAAVGNHDASVCPAGTVTNTVFSDSMENPNSGRWTATGNGMKYYQGVVGPLVVAPLWYYGSDPLNPYAAPQVYATSGTDNLWGDDPDLSSGLWQNTYQRTTYDAQMAMTRGVKLPPGASYLRFEHAFGFQTSGTALGNHDGGRVEYSTDGGRSWKDAGPLMAGAGDNGYGFNTGGAASSKLASDNPLHGAAAFTRHSQGYVASRAVLTSLAGKTVKFRFRILTNRTVGDYGWFVDDVKIYGCAPLLNLSTPPTVALGTTNLVVTPNDLHPTTTYRVRKAAPGLPFGAWSSSYAAPSNGIIRVPLVSGGGKTCVAVTTTVQPSGPSSSATRCVTVPTDDRGLRRHGSWVSVTSASSYARTLTVSRTKGAYLTLRAAWGTHVIVLAEKLRGGGTIGVYVGGRLVRTTSLASTTTRYKQQIDIRVGPTHSKPVVVKVLSSGRPVVIDGIAIRP